MLLLVRLVVECFRRCRGASTDGSVAGIQDQAQIALRDAGRERTSESGADVRIRVASLELGLSNHVPGEVLRTVVEESRGRVGDLTTLRQDVGEDLTSRNRIRGRGANAGRSAVGALRSRSCATGRRGSVIPELNAARLRSDRTSESSGGGENAATRRVTGRIGDRDTRVITTRTRGNHIREEEVARALHDSKHVGASRRRTEALSKARQRERGDQRRSASSRAGIEGSKATDCRRNHARCRQIGRDSGTIGMSYAVLNHETK